MKYNRAVIVDLECTCWPEANHPPGEQTEIIEIGVCLYEKQSGLSKKQSIFVRPEYSRISEFCTQLTGHTWDSIRSKAVPFKDAVRTLEKNYPLKTSPWLSWGDFDRIQFEKDCVAKDIPYPFGRTHINLKAIFALFKQRSKGMSVSNALKDLGLEFEGRPHNGSDDAWNIGRILQKLIIS